MRPGLRSPVYHRICLVLVEVETRLWRIPENPQLPSHRQKPLALGRESQAGTDTRGPPEGCEVPGSPQPRPTLTSPALISSGALGQLSALGSAPSPCGAQRVRGRGEWTFVSKMMSLLFNTLFRFVIAFLPRSKPLLISWLQSPSTVTLEPKKIKSVTVSIVTLYICHEVMGPDAMILIFF